MKPSKRQRSNGDASATGEPLTPPFMTDYRPYASGLLDRYLYKRTIDTNHKRNWDQYYRNNTVNGYKDRHYILREFKELRECIDRAVKVEASTPPGTSAETEASDFSWMEAGCGVGNAFLPVFAEYGHLPSWKRMVGFDISSVAIELLRAKVREDLPDMLQQKVRLTCLNPVEEDICTQDNLFTLDRAEKMKKKKREDERNEDTAMAASTLVESEKVQFVSMIFVLCSIPTVAHENVLRRVAACMPEGGIFFFRDYAVSDHAETRFRQRKGQLSELVDGCDVQDDKARTDIGGASHRSDSAADNTYTRTNGTLSHFFSVEEVARLFEKVGFRILDLAEVDREVQNVKLNLSLNRKFIQGRFILEKSVH